MNKKLYMIILGIFLFMGYENIPKENKASSAKIHEKTDILIDGNKKAIVPNFISVKTTNPALVIPASYSKKRKRVLVPKKYGESINTHRAIMSAFQRLKVDQNIDGSWGTAGNQQLSTAFALIALLRTGKSKSSWNFGKTVQSAHKWLLNSNPTTDPQRIVTAIALSDYYTTHYENKNQTKVPPKEINKIIECLDSVTPQCSELWKDFLIISRTPIEMKDKIIKKTYTKYFNRELPDTLLNLDDYMLFHLCFIAHYHYVGGKNIEKWKDANKKINVLMKQLQDKNGLFVCAPNADRISATGLFIMNLAVNYIFSNDYSPYLNPMKIYLQKKEDSSNSDSADTKPE